MSENECKHLVIAHDFFKKMSLVSDDTHCAFWYFCKHVFAGLETFYYSHPKVFFKKLYMLNIITEYTMVINLSLFIKLNQYG